MFARATVNHWKDTFYPGIILRKNEWARLQYQHMKYELADKANQDRKVYATLKELHINDFIDFIIAEEKRTNSSF
jgi:GrpB-like predicted nucleotidyltransferase (UPF0157 family)